MCLVRDAKGRYVLNQIRAPDSIIKFFSLLPICTGVAVKHDVEGVIKFYSLISDLEVTMKGFIEVSAVALVAGYALQARNMNAVAMQVLGVVMNKMCSTADNLWGARWCEIPESLKVYAIADLKIGHLAYSVFVSIILRDYIPDPEIFMFYLGKFDQWLAADWFLKLLANSLEGSEIHDMSFKNAVTRKDLVNSLRYRYSEDSVLMDEAPRRVLMWDSTRGEWPSLTKGGCRYLHQCRVWFVEMVRIWTQQGLKWSDGMKIPVVSGDLMHHATFKISPVLISRSDFSLAVDGTSGLLRSKSLNVKKLELDPETVKSYFIGKHCKKVNREQVPVVIEWARENPTQIADFLRRMGSDIEFQKFYRHLYDPLRHCYRRIFNCEALTVVFMEGVLIKTLRYKHKEEVDVTARLVEELKIRKSRISYLEEMIDANDDTLRARWAVDLPALPNWVVARQKRTVAKKRPCPKSDPEQDSKKVKFSVDPPQEIETLEPDKVQLGIYVPQKPADWEEGENAEFYGWNTDHRRYKFAKLVGVFVKKENNMMSQKLSLSSTLATSAEGTVYTWSAAG